jgi:hypothetical protein
LPHVRYADEEIANFLCRDVDDVREKITTLAARLDGYE